MVELNLRREFNRRAGKLDKFVHGMGSSPKGLPMSRFMRTFLVGAGFLIMASLVFAWSSTGVHRTGVPLSEGARVQPGRGRNLKRGSENLALRGGGSGGEVPDAQQRQSGLAKSQLDVVVDAMGASDADSAVSMLNEKFSDMVALEQPGAILKWAGETFPKKRWAQITSFGLSGLVITDMLAKMKLLGDMHVVTIDTLHLFPETYKLISEVHDYWEDLEDIKLYHCKRAETRRQFERMYGARLWQADAALYGYLTKIEPTKRALDELGVIAWLTGRRRSQGGERSELNLFEIDAGDGRLKINPLANWGREEVWRYIKKNAIPYNALHDQGYLSVGDTVSTEKAAESEGERGGRWRGSNNTECGIHHHTSASDSEGLAQKAERIRQGYAWEQRALERAREQGVTQVTQDNFVAEVAESDTAVLLDIYVPWCPHCRQFEPKFNEIAQVFAKAGERLWWRSGWTDTRTRSLMLGRRSSLSMATPPCFWCLPRWSASRWSTRAGKTTLLRL